jgi:hypothetical protein
LPGAGFCTDQLHCLVNHFLETKTYPLEFELARLDLRQIQNVVNQREQAGAHPAKYLGVLALFRI